MRTVPVSPMKAAKAGYIVMSCLFIAAGIALIVSPELLETTACAVCGGAMIAFGIVKLIGYFSKDLFRLAFQFDLAAGILLILLGTHAIVKPERFLGFIGIAFGIIVLADGLFKIQIALDSRTFGIRKWWLILAGALITSTAGVALILDPSGSAAVLGFILGLSLVCEGALNLITTITAVKIIENQLPDRIDVEAQIHQH